MIGGRIINKARVRVLILTEPVKETVKHGLFAGYKDFNEFLIAERHKRKEI